MSLVVDLPSGRLFWADMKKHSIESVQNKEGTQRITAVDLHRDSRYDICFQCKSIIIVITKISTKKCSSVFKNRNNVF